MLVRHEIFADEAWTHGNKPLRRYWCFFGGIFGQEPDLNRLNTKLMQVKASRQDPGEIKWSNLTPGNIGLYKKIVDCLLEAIDHGTVRYRQMFCDRSLVRVPPDGDPLMSDLDIQYKLWYQFLKHSFGLAYLDKGDDHAVFVRLDTHSSQKHKKRLTQFSNDIPLTLRHDRLTVNVTYEESDKEARIQVCDLMIGAAGSWGNNMHMLRAPGQRGMTRKQKARSQLCKHIYNGLRAIDAAGRGTHAFNWFESTGKDGDRANMLCHKVRIWKFIPSEYRIDKGWQNDNLDKYGQYVGPILSPEILSADANPLSLSRPDDD